LIRRDTNFDSQADLWQYFDEQNQLIEERQDTDFDNHIDAWTMYSNGQRVESRRDVNHDGTIDEVHKFDSEGREIEEDAGVATTESSTTSAADAGVEQ
jgi:hypothetical protein